MSETGRATVHVEGTNAVTSIIVQRPSATRMAAYEDWLREIVPVAQTFPGHRGVNIIRPHGHGRDYTIILHFADRQGLQAWLGSETRKRLTEKVRPLLDGDETIDVHPGIEYWFTPPEGRRVAPPWKQFLVTLSAIFPLSLLVPWLLSPVFAWLPALAVPGLRQFAVACLIVGLMTFLVMPRYVRLIAGWLYR